MKETPVGQELRKLMHHFGNLSVHVSGEAKVDLFGVTGSGSGWMGMFKTIISGDTGCMYPLEGYDVTALDQVMDILLSIETRPHCNIGDNEKYVIDTDTYKAEILAFKEEIKNDGKYAVRYQKEIKVDGVTVMVITIEPLCNEFVVGEFGAAKKNEFIGEIDDFDKPYTDSFAIMIGGDEYKVEETKLVTFRKFTPKKGDYLLKDLDKDVYVIIPGEDYSIH